MSRLYPVVSFNNQPLPSFKETKNKIEKGLNAYSFAAQVFSNNIACQGDPKFKDREVTLYSTPDGIEIGPLQEDQDPGFLVYEPENPAANKDGFILKKNDTSLKNLTNTMSASHAYSLLVSVADLLNKMERAGQKIGGD